VDQANIKPLSAACVQGLQSDSSSIVFSLYFYTLVSRFSKVLGFKPPAKGENPRITYFLPKETSFTIFNVFIYLARTLLWELLLSFSSTA
jgi:hypothetical protein